jgi:hypothetical protein
MGLIEISTESKKNCYCCEKKFEPDEKKITAIKSVYYGNVNKGALCRECFLMLVDDFDPQVLKKSVRDKIMQVKVARKV